MSRRAQRGSVLLAVVLLTAVATALSVALVVRATSLASELRARRDVLCARYAALGGLALGGRATDPVATAALIGPRVASLVVAPVLRSPSWCVLRASASCRKATRTLEHTAASVDACTAPAP